MKNNIKIEIIPCLQDNYSYLIIDEDKNDACVVDPSEAKPIINFVEKENINLKYILNTHHHFDHIGGNIELKEKYDSIVVGYKYDAERIPEINVLVEDNQIWKEDNFEAKIIHIPGHTTGHIAFYFFNEKIRSEEHTSELQSRLHLVCRLLLEKKKQDKKKTSNLS